MTIQQTGQPSQSTKHADEDVKEQDTAPTGFIAPRRPAFHLPKLRWQHILAISMQHIRPGEALSKKFARIGGIKAYQVTAIVVDAMVISRPWCVRKRGQ